MSRVIFKLKFEHPNLKSTKMNNMYHLLYIGTREGVALNDDVKEMENNHNEDYLKYIAHRPRSHGLFTNKDNVDINKVADELKNYNGYVYRGIVSLREEDSIKLGYDKKENWEKLLNDRMYYIARQFDIPYSRLRWVGAFHRESGHPHIHFMVWDKDNPVKSQGTIPKINIENVRKNFTNTIFKTEREQILLEKNSLRKLLLELPKGIQSNDLSKFNDLVEQYKEIDTDLMSEAEEINSYEIGNRVKNKMIEDIKKSIKNLEVPNTGRLQYKLMPPEVKAKIDKITDKILEEQSYRTYYEKYMNSVENLTNLYTNKTEDINKAKDNAKADIYSRIGNTILKTKRDMLYENNTSNFAVQSLLMNVFKTLSAKTNQNNNTKNLIGANKQLRKEYARKMIAKGLYSDKDLDNEI